MFTYKFVGLKPVDAETPYYYGSLPKRAESGQVIQIVDTDNFYRVRRVLGEGLKGKGGTADQQKLAWAEIGSGTDVPTIFLSPLLAQEETQFRKSVAKKHQRRGPKPKVKAEHSKKPIPIPILVGGQVV